MNIQHSSRRDKSKQQSCLIKAIRSNGFVFATGLLVGVLFQSTFILKLASIATTTQPNLSVPCKVCEEDTYWYHRKRIPFRGPFKAKAFEQYEFCMPTTMRYQFTLNGTIGLLGQPPSDEGKYPVPFGISDRQIYAPLANEQKHLFGQKFQERMVWTSELLEFLISEVASGKDISCADYPKSALDVRWALELLGVGPQDRLLVGGSISPWVEAVALHLQTGEVTTVDYSEPHCVKCHPRLQTIHMEMLMQKTSRAGFDYIVSYSSIEHDGLGRYGDPLDPYGDEHAMNEFWSLLREGGILLLAVPLWEVDQLVHLLARAYGPLRLPWLIKGWEYLGSVNKEVWSDRVPLKSGDWGWHPIIALRKTSSKDSNCTLDCSNSNMNKVLGHNSCLPSHGCGDLRRHWPKLDSFNADGDQPLQTSRGGGNTVFLSRLTVADPA